MNNHKIESKNDKKKKNKDRYRYKNAGTETLCFGGRRTTSAIDIEMGCVTQGYLRRYLLGLHE